MSYWPIGVFASVDEGLGVRWQVVRELSVPTIHLHAPSQAHRHQPSAESFRKKLDEMQVKVTAVFGGFTGESYADIPTTRATVGLVPPATRKERLAEMKEIAQFAHWLGSGVAALHLGFIPHPSDDPDTYRQIVDVTGELCHDCAARDQDVHLETGQETAEALIKFIDDVGCSNLFVNFDPANMILYGTGQPIPALRLLSHRVHSVHCKDAKWSSAPGREWGQETPLGDGDVGLREFLRTLQEIGYRGPLTIEREIPHSPDQQLQQIGQSVSLLTQLRDDLIS